MSAAQVQESKAFCFAHMSGLRAFCQLRRLAATAFERRKKNSEL